MRPPAPLALALVALLALPLSLGACKRDPSGAAGAGSAASSAGSASGAASASSTPNPKEFCAFLELLIVSQMIKADPRGELPVGI